jgi:integrase/recombinase XerD
VDRLKSDEIVESFLEDCKVRGMSPRTMPSYKSALKMFRKYLSQLNVDILEVNRDVLRGFVVHIREKGLSQRSLEASFSILSSFYEYLSYEGLVCKNPILDVRKRYLKNYKENGCDHERKLISIEDMAKMINSEMNIRDKAIITLLAKTGIRRNELISLDVSNIDLIEMKITLKPTHKRTNRIVFFDDETAFILRRWLKIREGMNKKHLPALLINAKSNRLGGTGVYDIVAKAAKRVGLNDLESNNPSDHFFPHCCRHWFTTHLRRAGMPREFIQELRGDVRKDAIDIYDHIDKKELRESYLAHIPQLGI